MTPEEQAAADAKAKADADAKKAADDAAAAEADKGEDGSDEGADGSEKKDKKDDELDLEKELEEERKRNADPEKARKAFAEREAKRKAEEDAAAAEQDGDKPLTRKDIAEIEDRAVRRLQNDQALAIAKTMAASEKEAQLIFIKWQNRSFPEHLPLQDQLEEAYAITHRKKFIGERQEALRALKSKTAAGKDAAQGHQDGAIPAEPKLSDADKSAIKAAGFEWDGTKRLYKKPLGGGKTHLYRDPKSGRTWRST